jgi:hypothetical protein
VEAREARIDGIFAQAGERSAWKHCATKFVHAAPFESCLVLFTVRHPASWLVGLFGNPYHALSRLPPTISEFLNYSWKTVERERLGGKTLRPLELYEAKLRSYRQFSSMLTNARISFRFIRFEDIVMNQEQVFRTVATEVGHEDAKFMPVEQSTKDSARHLSDYQDYYGAERWRERLAGVEDAVNREIDWNLIAPFGYAPITNCS